jgi:hypothetical protein
VSQLGPVSPVRPLAALTLVAAALAGPAGAAQAVAAPVPAAFTAHTGDAAPDGTAEVEGEHLPVAIHVGASHVDLPLWLKLDQPRRSVAVTLARASGDELAGATLTNDDPDTEFTGTLGLDARDIKGWGSYRWTVVPQDGRSYTVSAKVRSHSQLGLEADRDGDDVEITGSLRAYHSVLNTYKPWKGRRVLVQRWDDGGWVTVRSLTTDRSGDVKATIKLPWTVQLRLTATTSSKIWGAESKHVVL